MKKKCFSYIRFSSLRQRDNTSVARQLEIAPRVAKEMGWDFDESLNIQDLGLSAYSGSNVKTINGIIAAVKSGKIPQGSVCILEALDRFSRLELDESYQLLRSVLKSGIEVYTDNSRRHLTVKDLNNPMSVMLTVVELDSAFQYSAKLSERENKAWNIKRNNLQNGDKLTKKVVGWIDAETWKPIPERVTVVKRIFKMFVEGHGLQTIVKTLNGENVPSFYGKSWGTTTIARTLRNIAVIGQFQTYKCKKVMSKNGRAYNQRVPIGDVIKDYYPRIISDDVFYTIQDKLSKQPKVQKTETIGNLFSGLAFCKSCGGRMYLACGKKRNYYICWNRLKNKDCKEPTFRYVPLESSVMELFRNFPNHLYQPTMDTNTEVDILRGKIVELTKQVENITNMVVGGTATKSLVARQGELEQQIEKLEGELNIAKSKTSSKRNDLQEYEWIKNHLGEFRTNMELRRRVREFCLSNWVKMNVDGRNRKFTVKCRNGKTIPFEFATDMLSVKIGDNEPIVFTDMDENRNP